MTYRDEMKRANAREEESRLQNRFLERKFCRAENALQSAKACIFSKVLARVKILRSWYMRIFHGRLVFDKYTDRKYRWVKDVDGVKFKLYIQEERVPQPSPKVIEVSIFRDRKIYSNFLGRVGSKTIGELTSFDKDDLAAIGLDEAMMKVAGGTAILGGVSNPDPDHTETVRYNAFRHDPTMEFGDPYIPKSVLGDTYPDRLLFLVRWIA